MRRISPFRKAVGGRRKSYLINKEKEGANLNHRIGGERIDQDQEDCPCSWWGLVTVLKRAVMAVQLARAVHLTTLCQRSAALAESSSKAVTLWDMRFESTLRVSSIADLFDQITFYPILPSTSVVIFGDLIPCTGRCPGTNAYYESKIPEGVMSKCPNMLLFALNHSHVTSSNWTKPSFTLLLIFICYQSMCSDLVKPPCVRNDRTKCTRRVPVP